MKGLYVHIPFCVKKCDYCDFVSFSGCENKFSRYIDAVEKEMVQYSGTEVDTVFIGGGTPSVLSAEQIVKLCDCIKNHFKLSDDVEWTMEINPGTIDDEKIEAMKSGGVNRVSVGVQSFDDGELLSIGRIHNAKTAIRTVEKLHDAGFCNISIDLMMSLPNQTPQSFKKTLECAMKLPIEHISIYSLIIEEGTPIAKKYENGEYAIPDDDIDREMYAYTNEFLKKYGFERYEISNYAKPGFESRHNLKYWDCDEYIGIGVAAHSYIDKERFSNTSDLDGYLSGKVRESSISIDKDDAMGEFMMLGLRKTKGVNSDEFRFRFGTDINDKYGDIFDKYIKLGFMEKSGKYYRLNDKGLDVSNSIMCEFL